jgi:crossover junction endodeoxyribonuclease RuvC
MQVVVGVDPGLVGALAAVEAARLLDVIDVPCVGVKGGQRVGALAIRNWIRQHAPVHCYIERAQGFPQQGRSSIFKFGRATGAIEAVLACCEIPLTVVEPAAWKRFHHLYGKDKEGSRQRALQLFPAAHSLLAHRKDHNRAEALLLATYGASQSRVAA